jgi:hypothetical protein
VRRQPILFDDPPAQRHSPTSVAAAESIKPDANRLRMVVLSAIRDAPDGLTCDECEVLTGLRHQTCSARFRELALGGRIVDTGQTRKTRSGRAAAVWQVVV